jgi:hypothetical protein
VTGAALRARVHLALLVVARVRGDRLIMVARGSGLESCLPKLVVFAHDFRGWFGRCSSMANRVVLSFILDCTGILATEVLLESNLHLNGDLSRI